MRVKDVVSNDRYIITEDGHVFNKKRGTELHQHLNSKGYFRVFLWFGHEDKPKAVHRLVAETFLRKRQGADEVNHLDGNKTNNHVGNLEWCTRLENVRHFHRNLLA